MNPDPQLTLSSLPLAVIVLDPGFRVAAVNPASEQMLGQSARRLTGHIFSDLVRFADTRLAERIAAEETALTAHDALIQVGGVMRRLDASISPLADSPGWRVLTLMERAPAVGRTGQGEAVLRAPEVLAHEIKNPLAGIRGAAQLLARNVQAADLPLTTLIAAEVDRVAGLIDRMQSLSRSAQTASTPCNVHEAVHRALAVLTARGGLPAIEESFDPSLPLALADFDALVQIVINLVANAAEACGNQADSAVVVRTRYATGIHITAGAGTMRTPIELRISDNGPGLSETLADHIFEPFVSSKPNGQGLGLALVSRLVRDMNGRISHDRDDTGNWTHFRVFLPQAAMQ